MDIVCFRQDGKWFGLPQGSVADLVPTARIEPLQAGPSFVGGATSYRERSLLAVRLCPLLWPDRFGDWLVTRRSVDRVTESLLVVGRDAVLIGLPSESVGCILDVRPERLVEHQVKSSRPSVIRTLLYHLDREITFLDPTRLIRLLETVLGETALRLFSAGADGRVAGRCV